MAELIITSSCIPESNSGTYEFFKEHVLSQKDFHPIAQHMPGTSAVVGAVAMDRWGIGYGGAAYTVGVREIPVALDDTNKEYLPTEDNILSGKYPISRFLFFYLREKPKSQMNPCHNFYIKIDPKANSSLNSSQNGEFVSLQVFQLSSSF